MIEGERKGRLDAGYIAHVGIQHCVTIWFRVVPVSNEIESSCRSRSCARHKGVCRQAARSKANSPPTRFSKLPSFGALARKVTV
ncbi:hypothetical protein EVAR_7060_1 [Eumeta japonica]|uniref:Uncharacterized protein n=1 Tax=Eumeta variegata TaxID=151549 RepID=A0A4C1XCM6_EUMVA|nr:hypothetical protein EVAR_7060_1 [Eumeta japonica]